MKTHTLSDSPAQAVATSPAPRYVIASLPAWREAAAQAIANGQTEGAFLATVHAQNQTNARNAFRVELAARRAAIAADWRAEVRT